MNDFVELRRVVSVVFRHWWILLLATLVAGAAGYMISLTQDPVYRATASVLVGQSIQATQLDTRDIQTSERLALTYADIARRQPVLEAAIDHLDLDVTWESLRRRVKVNLVPDTQLLEISVEAGTREEARLITAELARQLILLSPASLQNQPTDDDTESFVKRRLEELQADIEVSERRAHELKAALIAAETAEEKASLQAEIDELEGKILNWDSNYARFLAFVESEESANYISLIDDARAKRGRVRPHMTLNTLIAATVGFALALGAIFLYEFLDDTLKTTADISQSLNLTPLGVIGEFGGNDPSDKLVFSANPFSPAAESYRMIRSNIEFAAMGATGKAIMVTSPEPGDGKSITAINLATAMARNGRRTILVDSDMRHSTLHKILQIPNHEGLSDQLCRHDPGEYIPVRDIDIADLNLMTAGTKPPNPAELLSSRRMDELLTSLKNLADVIIIDTPPATLVADPVVLSEKVDGVILVVLAGKTRREVAKQAVFNLEQSGANILGVVLNRAVEGSGRRYGKYASDPGKETRSGWRALGGLQGVSNRFQNARGNGSEPWPTRVDVAAILQGIPGVGPKRQQLLVERFGSLDNIRQATTEEIAAVNGIPYDLAQTIKGHLD